MSIEMNTQEVINLIKNSKKKTPVKVYLKGELDSVSFGENVKSFISGGTGVIFGDWADIQGVLENHRDKIEDYVVESDRRNSAIPMLDTKNINARIEPGAYIREMVSIGDNAVIMMGAVVNIGVEIGEGSMIDMGAVLGGRVKVGKMCHIGAGVVLAGVIEPPSAQPVVVGDDALIGANSVVLEGVQIGEGAVVAAGSVVTEDVPPFSVVAGTPARVIKQVDAKTKSKTEILKELRTL